MPHLDVSTITAALDAILPPEQHGLAPALKRLVLESDTGLVAITSKTR